MLNYDSIWFLQVSLTTDLCTVFVSNELEYMCSLFVFFYSNHTERIASESQSGWDRCLHSLGRTSLPSNESSALER